MSMDIQNHLSQEIQQITTLSQQLQHMLRVLHFGSDELQSYLNDVCQVNPTLQVTYSSIGSSGISPEIYQAAEKDSSNYLYQSLVDQLNLEKVDQELYECVRYLIYQLDDDGYFICSFEFLLQTFDRPLLERGLSKLHEFEPIGIGAFSLKQCLMLQTPKNDTVTLKILKNHLNEVAQNNISTISRSLKLPKEKVLQAVERIKGLSPKPAAGFVHSDSHIILVPDIYVETDNNQLKVRLNDALMPKIYVNTDYLEMMRVTSDDETRTYLQHKINQSLMIRDAVAKRNRTLERVSQVILNYQKLFFLKGKGNLKPLILKDVAEELDLSISTISRAVSNKYLQSRYGLFPLKYFFRRPYSSKGDGIDFSSDLIVSKIKALIQQENKEKPFSDQSIADQLKAMGYHVSRRTVAKYRLTNGILKSTDRKKRGGHY